MKNKIVLWGTNAADERILVALELKVDDNKVMVYTFPEAIATDDFYQQMMELWRNDQEGVTFPDGHQALKRELSISEGLLPDDIKTERSDVILRAQTEWHFTVLSSKLSEAYRSELKDLEDKLAGLRSYDKDLWDNLKQFWDKVQSQLQERTLVREHADELRARTNKAFEDLKDLRKRMDDDFRESSKANMDKFTEAIQGIEQKIRDNKHLSKVFDDLKQLQKDLRDVALTRDHRNKLWQKVDDAFKIVKEKRFGEKPAEGRADNNPLGRTESRYNGLMDAIDKMERSIRRDQEDLDFQQQKINDTDGQLEAQIRQAKIQMIEQRFSSKKEKLDEMLKTKQQLEERMEREKAQQEKREAQQREEAARREAANKAKEKIAEDIRRQQEELQQDPDALESAAKAINQQKGKATAAVAAVAAGVAAVVNEVANEVADATEPAPVAEEPVVEPAPIVEEPMVEPAPVVEAPAAPAAEASAEAEPETEAAPDKSNDSLFEAIGITLSESLEDVVDTVRAVAEVVSHQVQEKVEEIKEDISDLMKQEEE